MNFQWKAKISLEFLRQGLLTGSRGMAFFILIGAGIAGAFPANFISASEKIDINSAPLEDLVKIIHIGEVRALELISLRPFSSLDDLTRIKGIGPSRVEDIKNQGLAWIATEEPAKEEPVEDENQQYPEGIVFSKILPSPEGPDEENEWIELYNKNSLEVNLSGWQIKDTEGKTKTYTFPETTFIESNQSLSLPRPLSGITMNNQGDTLILFQPDGQEADSVSYLKAERGVPFVLTDEGWTREGNQLPKEEPLEITEEETLSKEKLAAKVKQEDSPKEGLKVGLIALLLASFSGIMILLLRRKCLSKDSSS